jgi:rubredoxin
MANYKCTKCGFIYDEEKEEKKWDQLPDDWVCPTCGANKSSFKHAAEVKTGDIVKKKVKCRVCGFIMDEEHPGDVCPACGVPKTAFQPYVDRLPAKRRKILNLHLHSMAVHFPQAFSLLMLFLSVTVFFIQDPLKSEFMAAFKILSIFLPFSVAASIMSGIIDGKNRFKRITTPILKRKIMVAVLFLVYSIGVLLILNFSNLQFIWQWLLVALNVPCVLSSIFLGYNGGRLSGLEMP